MSNKFEDAQEQGFLREKRDLNKQPFTEAERDKLNEALFKLEGYEKFPLIKKIDLLEAKLEQSILLTKAYSLSFIDVIQLFFKIKIAKIKLFFQRLYK